MLVFHFGTTIHPEESDAGAPLEDGETFPTDVGVAQIQLPKVFELFQAVDEIAVREVLALGQVQDRQLGAAQADGLEAGGREVATAWEKQTTINRRSMYYNMVH